MDLSFIPTILLSCATVIVLIIWWNKRHKIKLQPCYSYNLQNEDDEEPATGKNITVNSTTPVTEENSSDFLPPTSEEGHLDELYAMDTPNVEHKKTSKADKKEQLKILLEEQDYLEDLAGRKTTSKISIKNTIKLFFQNQTVKNALLIIGALALFAGLVTLTIIAGKNSWFG